MSIISPIRPISTKLRAGEVFNVLNERPLHSNGSMTFFSGSGWRCLRPWSFLVTQGEQYVEVPVYDTKNNYCGFHTREEAVKARDAFNKRVEAEPNSSTFILLRRRSIMEGSYLVDHCHFRSGDSAWVRIGDVPTQTPRHQGRYTRINYKVDKGELVGVVTYDGEFEIIRIIPE